jgi:hypothetical protein
MASALTFSLLIRDRAYACPSRRPYIADRRIIWEIVTRL